MRAAMDIARGLTRRGLLSRYHVTLIDRNDRHVFIPLLYKVAARPEPEHEDACTYDIASLVRTASITFIKDTMTGADPATGTIALESGRTLHADSIIFALGSETNYFGIPGLKDHALQLKTIESAQEVRRALQEAFAKGGNVRIIAGGGGPNGIELAAEIRQWADREETKNPNLHAEVSIIEAMPSILTGFAPRAVAIARARLKQLGVAVMTGMKIVNVTANAITAEHGAAAAPAPSHDHEVHEATHAAPPPAPAQQETVPFDVFIWTGGTRTPEILNTIPLKKDAHGRPLAAQGLACLPGSPDLAFAPKVYGIGDNVCFIDPKTSRPTPAVAHVAILEGQIAAHNLLEEVRHEVHASHTPHPTHYEPAEYPWVIPIGENWAVAKIGPLIVSGRMGWWFARIVELYYLFTIMPPRRALQSWLRMGASR
jgi:NADH dehydrogenase